MRIAISSGHSTKCPGASGYVDEVEQATRVVDRVAELLGCPKFHDTTSTNSSDNLSRIVGWHNSQSRDLDVSVHFNAYQTKSGPMGTEVLYVTQQQLADDVSAAIATAGGFIDRGPKYRTDLYFLNKTAKPAILIEVCFCDSRADCDLYAMNFEQICEAIAEAISGQDVEPPAPEPQPPEPPEQIPTVAITISGNVRLIVNGEEIGSEAEAGTAGTPLHQEITATVFGSAGDEQPTAYGGYVSPSSCGVALPYKFAGDRPMVIVQGPRGQATCEIIDVGPWNTNDPAYVQDEARPLVEQQFASKTPAQNGRVPTNDAGIDLAPQTATAIGISGRGKVSWRFA